MRNDWGMAYINLIYCSICPAVSETTEREGGKQDDKGTCLVWSAEANKCNLRCDIKGLLFLPYHQLNSFVVTHWFGLKSHKIKCGLEHQCVNQSRQLLVPLVWACQSLWKTPGIGLTGMEGPGYEWIRCCHLGCWEKIKIDFDSALILQATNTCLSTMHLI